MIHGNVEAFPYVETWQPEGSDGVGFQRVPEAVRVHLNDNAKRQVRRPGAGEIRFVCEGEARITLSSSDVTRVSVSYGGYLTGAVQHVTTEPTTITLTPNARFMEYAAQAPTHCAFSPAVRRLQFAGAPVFFHSIEGEGVRPPTVDELPRRKYLSYGTSITHGAAATAPHLTYVAQAAWRLNADLINLGVGGACHCEKEFADHIAERDDWTFATLALSVNMIGAGFTKEQFHERTQYLVNAVAGSNTTRPVVCITIYPHFRDLSQEPHPQSGVLPDDFRAILRDVVDHCPHPNVRLIEGSDLLTDYAGLTPDMIHPNDLGFIEMGERLAARLRPLVEASE